MPRTIGKYWISEVKRLVDTANKLAKYNNDDVIEYVIDHLDAEVFDMWEGVTQEVTRIAYDYNMR